MGSCHLGARLLALKQLGCETIPVTVVDLEKIVFGEYAENTFRKAFTPSECADIADAIEPIERALAKERQIELGRTHGTPREKSSTRVEWQVPRQDR
jgi:ParB-like chromosome segregation protein Spo0J